VRVAALPLRPLSYRQGPPVSGRLCCHCQEPGTDERPLELAGEHHAASGAGATFWRHRDCPKPHPLASQRIAAIAEAVARKTRTR